MEIVRGSRNQLLHNQGIGLYNARPLVPNRPFREHIQQFLTYKILQKTQRTPILWAALRLSVWRLA